MKFKRKITSLVLALALFYAMLSAGAVSTEVSIEQERTVLEQRIYSNATIDQEFCGSSVLVVMDRSLSQINRVHSERFFRGIAIQEIVDLSIVFNEDLLTPEDYRATPTASNRAMVEAFAERSAMQTDSTRGTEPICDIWQIDRSNFRQILQLRLPIDCKQNVLDVIRQLERIDGVLVAEPDYYGQFDDISTTSNAPLNTSNNAPVFGNGEALNRISVPAAWNITRGNTNVRVGVIDSGITDHVDFRADPNNPNTSIIDRNAGWNFHHDNNETIDVGGHGTKTAGIIASGRAGLSGNNGIGVANVTLVPLRLTSTPNAPWLENAVSRIANAITHSTNWGIQILNLSGRVPSNNVLEQAIRNYPGLFIAAAGNDEANNCDPCSFSSPQSYILPNLIIVGASLPNDNRASYSNFSVNRVHLFAPAETLSTCRRFSTGGLGSCGLLGTCANNGNSRHCNYGGTSCAAPHVAGVAALILSAYPRATPGQIKWAILNGVDTVANGGLPANSDLTNLSQTGGRLNAHGALMAMTRISDPTYGIHRIRNASNGSYLDSHSAIYNNSQIQLLNSIDDEYQRWIVQRMPLGNTYEIRSMATMNGSIRGIRNNGNNAFITTVVTQRTRVTVQQNANGTVTFREGNRVLAANGTSVVWVVNAGIPTAAQSWRLETQTPAHQIGDANRSGGIDSNDALGIIRYATPNMSSVVTDLYAYSFFLADVDRNGSVEMCDASEIFRKLLGSPNLVDNVGNEFSIIADGWYNIQASHGRFVRTANNGSTNGTRLELWDTRNNSSRFHFEHMGNGYYRIRTALSNRFVEVMSSSHNNGAAIQISDRVNLDRQLWRIIRKGDYFIFVNVSSGKGLEVINGANQNGALIQQWALYNGSGSQLFNLVPA
jgi:subtilisin family serine protease